MSTIRPPIQPGKSRCVLSFALRILILSIIFLVSIHDPVTAQNDGCWTNVWAYSIFGKGDPNETSVYGVPGETVKANLYIIYQFSSTSYYDVGTKAFLVLFTAYDDPDRELTLVSSGDLKPADQICNPDLTGGAYEGFCLTFFPLPASNDYESINIGPPESSFIFRLPSHPSVDYEGYAGFEIWSYYPETTDLLDRASAAEGGAMWVVPAASCKGGAYVRESESVAAETENSTLPYPLEVIVTVSPSLDETAYAETVVVPQATIQPVKNEETSFPGWLIPIIILTFIVPALWIFNSWLSGHSSGKLETGKTKIETAPRIKATRKIPSSPLETGRAAHIDDSIKITREGDYPPDVHNAPELGKTPEFKKGKTKSKTGKIPERDNRLQELLKKDEKIPEHHIGETGGKSFEDTIIEKEEKTGRSIPEIGKQNLDELIQIIEERPTFPADSLTKTRIPEKETGKKIGEKSGKSKEKPVGEKTEHEYPGLDELIQVIEEHPVSARGEGEFGKLSGDTTVTEEKKGKLIRSSIWFICPPAHHTAPCECFKIIVRYQDGRGGPGLDLNSLEIKPAQPLGGGAAKGGVDKWEDITGCFEVFDDHAEICVPHRLWFPCGGDKLTARIVNKDGQGATGEHIFYVRPRRVPVLNF